MSINQAQITAVFDANSLWARSYFAAGRNLIEPQTDPRPACDIFIRSAASILNPVNSKFPANFHPTHSIFCWDGKPKNDKNRPPKPQVYYDGQKIVAERTTRELGSTHAYPTYEADDAVATIAWNQTHDGHAIRAYIISGDKDLQQMVDDSIFYYSLNDKKILTEEEICLSWKVASPSYVPFALAIIGDKSDNISGVHKWGIKKVEKLFKDIPAGLELDKVFDRLTAQMSEEQVQQFQDSLQLTLLNTDILDELPEPGKITGFLPINPQQSEEALDSFLTSVY